MAHELIRPIDPDTARAIEEVAKSGGKLIEAGTNVGTYLDRIIGRVPDNIVGLLIGDWLIHKRMRRWAELQAETSEYLKQWRVEEPFEEASPSVAIPLVEAAIDENREGLKQLWAKLLAASIDPKRRELVRQSFIVTVKQFDPLDVAVMEKIFLNEKWSPSIHEALSKLLQTSVDEIFVSLQNLERLACINQHVRGVLGDTRSLSSYGRLLMRTIRD